MDGRDATWPELYRDYLRSHEWAMLRAKVMRRAQHCCEGCGDTRPTEVHHLTYENVTREFLFELVALCTECHERLHVQRGKPERPKKATWSRRHNPAPRDETETSRTMRMRLADMAAEARKKLMGSQI